MVTFYRASPYTSNKIRPVPWDKKELVKRCLYSFLEAGGTNITFILDGFTQKESVWFTEFGQVYDATGQGNVGTFHTQLELAPHDDKVLFVEDDYMWRPATVPLLEKALDTLDFVSPYDHPAHYTEDRFSKQYNTVLIDNIVYRDSPSNTLTFGVKGQTLAKLKDRMKTFGVADHPMFEHLASLGYKIWNPTYSFATHLEKDLLAPNVDWNHLLKT